MKAKPVVARERANRDIDEAIAWYLGEHAAHAAFGFIDAVERDDHIDIWRVLHSQRDIPAWMGVSNPP